ncbi:MAG: hypothetical protein PF513_01710 [Tenericutes bacterium]|jgi:hypothetical protein|nr:hypothetical protein [Mycoplasmatota bacterium]
MVKILKEYQSWYSENRGFFEGLKVHQSLLYTRLYPIYDVLYYLYKENKNSDSLDEDINKIIQVGLEYLHQQVFTCKLYYEKFFNKDFHAFLEYDRVVNYILFLEDLKYELKEKNIDYDQVAYEDIVEYLELMISEKKEVPENLNAYIDSRISNFIQLDSYDFLSIIDIFVEIGDTLGLSFDEEEIIIGEDI